MATMTKAAKDAEQSAGSMAGKSKGKVSRTAKRAASKPKAVKPDPIPEKAAAVKPKPETKAAKPVARTASVLGHSVTSVAKALGKAGWENDKAKKAIAKLIQGECKPATISTALADGRNPKYNVKGVASLSKEELRKLTAAAK